jgi:hypothetical protein
MHGVCEIPAIQESLGQTCSPKHEGHAQQFAKRGLTHTIASQQNVVVDLSYVKNCTRLQRSGIFFYKKTAL